MPSFVTPSSFGSSTSALAEFNYCHAPAGTSVGGRFCTTTRAVYGASEDDPEALQFNPDEAQRLNQKLLHGSDDESTTKDEIAGELETGFDDSPGFVALYEEVGDQVTAHLSEIGHGGGSEGEIDYSGYEDQYQEWKQDEIDRIDEEYRNAQSEEFASQKQSFIDDMQNRYSELDTMWAQEVEKLKMEGRAQYGEQDVSYTPTLLDVGPGGGAEFLQTVRFELKDKVLDPKEVLDTFGLEHDDEIITAEGSRSADETDIALRAYVRQQILDNYVLGDLTDEAAVKGHEYFDDANEDGFDEWFRHEGGEPDYDKIDDYETWAQNQGYGSSDDGGGVDSGSYSSQKAMASFLVNKWAGTSGDSDKISIAMQIAAEHAFGIENAYKSKLTAEPDAYAQGNGFYLRHKEQLEGFLQKMHEDTQQSIPDTRRGGTSNYVTLYRGFTLPGAAREPGVSTIDMQNGSVVDVNLQPLSSFSTSVDTARGFSGHGEYQAGKYQAAHPLIMAMRVPKAKIIGSYRTGYGCMHENEIVVLGGRYPAFVMASSGTTTERFKQRLREIARLYRQKGQDPTPVPGEAL